MIAELISALTALVSGFVSIVVECITTFATAIYDSTAGAMTVFGYFLLIGLGIMFLSMGINLIVRLVKR